jgi:hypothetical protein
MTVPIPRDNPFFLKWLVPAQGYEWVPGLDSQPRLVVRVSADADPGSYVYAPLDDEKLFLKFAALKSNREGIRKFADEYGNLWRTYPSEIVKRKSGSYSNEEMHGYSLLAWKYEIESLRELVELWKNARAARTEQLKKTIAWDGTDTVKYKLHDSWFVLANANLNQILLERCKPPNLVKPAMYLLQSQINNRLESMKRQIIPRLVWCPGRRINGIARPDDHLRVIFQPKDLLAAIWLQFAQAITEEYRLHKCEGCGEMFQVGKGARRSHTVTCSSKCRKRVSRARHGANQ